MELRQAVKLEGLVVGETQEHKEGPDFFFLPSRHVDRGLCAALERLIVTV